MQNSKQLITRINISKILNIICITTAGKYFHINNKCYSYVSNVKIDFNYFNL